MDPWLPGVMETVAVTVRPFSVNSDNSGLFGPVDFAEWDGLDYLDLSRSSCIVTPSTMGWQRKGACKRNLREYTVWFRKGTWRRNFLPTFSNIFLYLEEWGEPFLTNKDLFKISTYLYHKCGSFKENSQAKVASTLFVRGVHMWLRYLKLQSKI